MNDQEELFDFSLFNLKHGFVSIASCCDAELSTAILYFIFVVNDFWGGAEKEKLLAGGR